MHNFENALDLSSPAGGCRIGRVGVNFLIYLDLAFSSSFLYFFIFKKNCCCMDLFDKIQQLLRDILPQSNNIFRKIPDFLTFLKKIKS